MAEVHAAASKRILILPHADQRMKEAVKRITADELRRVLETGEVIEDYPEDRRGHSCLLLGRGKGDRPIHVVCAPKPEFLAVIAAYLPDPEKWSADFRKRE